jgi:hypothetical protein
MTATWESLHAADLPAVDAIANLIHPTLPERIEVLAEKLSLFSRGGWKLVLGHKILGYAIAHPWKIYSVPSLDTFLKNLPNNADCLYLHDIAILPEARGHQAAARCISNLNIVARTLYLPQMACVSVYGSFVLWQRYGFHIVPCPALEQKQHAYGSEAKYMLANTT